MQSEQNGQVYGKAAYGGNVSEEIYFAYSATLRIFGVISDLEEITERLGVAPSATHRKGDRGWGPSLPPYEHDMWSYSAPVKKTEPLHARSHATSALPSNAATRRSEPAALTREVAALTVS
jgi:Domain of unknown function (DUF4279)